MQRSILFGIVGLIIGLAVGFFAANQINRSGVSQSLPAQNQPSAALPNQPHGMDSQGGMMPDVTETLEKAKNEPNNFEAQIKAGDMYAQIRRFERAVEFFERAHKVNPNDFTILTKLGNAYFDLEQFETAEKWYLLALQQKEDINVRTDLGITFIERKEPDFERAVKEFQTSLQSDPKHEQTIYNLGVAYFKKGDKENLEKTITRLEEINPKSELAGRLRQISSQN
ncbi:MAG TPA: tetratricopeptide repeat protein [Pyrinomonadaceae bacterium]|nr:tetratricopeptide repeat protein [Pyrinomonadaceae bacterium]